jgi:hypothetical protein
VKPLHGFVSQLGPVLGGAFCWDTGGAGERPRAKARGCEGRGLGRRHQAGSAEMNGGSASFHVVSDGTWNLNIDLEQRDHLATIDLQPNLIGIHGDVLVDGGQNIFAKDRDKVGIAAASFVHQQHLQSMVSGGG